MKTQLRRQHRAAQIEITQTDEGYEITVTTWKGHKIHDFGYTQKKAIELGKQYAEQYS
jgi:hypothetical protein